MGEWSTMEVWVRVLGLSKFETYPAEWIGGWLVWSFMDVNPTPPNSQGPFLWAKVCTGIKDLVGHLGLIDIALNKLLNPKLWLSIEYKLNTTKLFWEMLRCLPFLHVRERMLLCHVVSWPPYLEAFPPTSCRTCFKNSNVGSPACGFMTTCLWRDQIWKKFSRGDEQEPPSILEGKYRSFYPTFFLKWTQWSHHTHNSIHA